MLYSLCLFRPLCPLSVFPFVRLSVCLFVSLSFSHLSLALRVFSLWVIRIYFTLPYIMVIHHRKVMRSLFAFCSLALLILFVFLSMLCYIDLVTCALNV